MRKYSRRGTALIVTGGFDLVSDKNRHAPRAGDTRYDRSGR
jgi:hypothetical protein